MGAQARLTDLQDGYGAVGRCLVRRPAAPPAARCRAAATAPFPRGGAAQPQPGRLPRQRRCCVPPGAAQCRGRAGAGARACGSAAAPRPQRYAEPQSGCSAQTAAGRASSVRRPRHRCGQARRRRTARRHFWEGTGFADVAAALEKWAGHALAERAVRTPTIGAPLREPPLLGPGTEPRARAVVLSACMAQAKTEHAPCQETAKPTHQEPHQHKPHTGRSPERVS